ncbi:MAG: orotidine-5'-phosphate decarboxylase [Microbacteriaceae bacterium]
MPVESQRTFGDALTAAFGSTGHLCVGIDPHEFLLKQWGLPNTADGVLEFGLRVIEAVQPHAGIVKPQVAFFERFGSSGFAALERILSVARDAGLIVIGDAKRGDVGTTVSAYAEAWLTRGTTLEVDAMTISAFQGLGSISEARTFALSGSAGLFVLAATSNPESIDPQSAIISTGPNAGQSVSGSIVAGIHDWNRSEIADRTSALGSVGVVIGATVNLEQFGVDLDTLHATPILAPGFGHQGAQYEDIPRIFGKAASTVIVSSSRSILAAGPAGLGEAIRLHSSLISEVLP